MPSRPIAAAEPIVPVEGDGASLSPPERLAIHATLAAILLLPQIGLSLGSLSIAVSLPLFIAQVAILAFRRSLRVDAIALLLFAAVATVTSFSLILNGGPSATSLVLLIVLYFPMTLVAARGDPDAPRRYTTDLLVRYTAVVAVAGCLQFVLQFVPGAIPWLDIRRIIPAGLAQTGGYNTFAFASGILRSNGYFLLEPSSLSLYSGLALVAEWSGRRRPVFVMLLGCGLAVALSGSGLIVVLLALGLPLLFRRPLYALLSLAGLVVAIMVLRSIGLAFLVDRLTEFGSPGSSGYARFVAPSLVLSDGFDLNPWSAVLGNGPGATLRAILARISAFEIFDPTWTKLLYEYGLVGSGCFLAFLVATLRRSLAPPEVLIAVIYAWLFAGGLLLQPNFVPLLPMLLCWWRRDKTRAARNGEMNGSPGRRR